jgi:hypothetical protein
MLKLILSCISHPEVLVTGFLVGYLAPSNLSNLTSKLITLISPLIGWIISGIKNLIGKL